MARSLNEQLLYPMVADRLWMRVLKYTVDNVLKITDLQYQEITNNFSTNYPLSLHPPILLMQCCL